MPRRVQTPPNPSSEQSDVLTAIERGQNVQITALAGTGKTTTASLLASKFPHMDILVLTYNRNLADESNAVFRQFALTNIVCRTYHEQIGLVDTVAQRKRVFCKNDRDVLKMLAQWERVPPPPLDDLDLIILDETQDMKATLRRALHFMLPTGTTTPMQLVVMGDPNQLIYDYDTHDPADPRFIINAPSEFSEHSGGREWCEMKLTISYRLTQNVTRFINLMWKTDIIPGNVHSPNLPVEYWVTNPFGQPLTKALERLLSEEPPNEVVFLNMQNLVNKVTSKDRPIQTQVNRLLTMTNDNGKRRFNFHTQQSDGTKCASIENKIRAWTFASSKGCTFPVVVVFGFSVFNGILPKMNQLCVALSRASRRLIVIHNTSYNVAQPYVPPLKSALMHTLIEEGVVVCPQGIPHDRSVPKTSPPKTEVLSVTAFTHLSAKTIDHLLSMGTRTVNEPETEALSYTQLIDFHTGAEKSEEDVSPLYGIGVMFAVEYKRTRCISHIECLMSPVSLQSRTRYTTEAFVDIVRRTLDISLTPSEMSFIDKIMSGESQTATGDDLIKCVRTSRLSFPSLQGHGICERAGNDAIFTHAYMDLVRAVYQKPDKVPADFMFLANASMAFEGTHEVLKQIGSDVSSYDAWVETDVFMTAVQRVMDVLPAVCSFEVDLFVPFIPPMQGSRLNVAGIAGRVDVGCDGTSMEVKFCNSLTDEHELQNLLYAAMNCISNNSDIGRSTLFNSRTAGSLVHEISNECAHGLLREVARLKAY